MVGEIWDGARSLSVKTSENVGGMGIDEVIAIECT